VPGPRPDPPHITIVVPVLDEADCVEELVRRVREAMAGTDAGYEILFVDDGSRDRTPERIAELHKADPARVRMLRFTRSFGHQAALTAGLRHARGDAVVTMDGDLQHPPEFLPTLIDAWRGGADVVNTIRRLPPGAARSRKERVAHGFYRLMAALTSIPVIPAGADFRLLDRRAVDAFNALEERSIYVRGLIPWLGFPETRVEYEVGDRYAGRSKYSLWPMLRLALDGIFSFSVLPLRLISLLGLATTLFGVAFGIFAVVAQLTGAAVVSGWTSVVVLILIFGGVQLLSVGILAEYVGRVYAEVKRRPRYVIDSQSEPDSP
jgi:glycosyltransferase involved in cell wall biosynthesis